MSTGSAAAATTQSGSPPVSLPEHTDSEHMPPSGSGHHADNLGSMENIHNKTHDIFPVPFEGAKVVVNKGLSQHFQVSHSLTMSSPEQSGYKFGVTYVGHKKVTETDMYPVILGELQPNGNMQAQVIHQVCDWWRVRYVGQIQSGVMAGQQLTQEFRGRSWQLAGTIINPDLVRNQFMGVVDFMKQVTSRLSMGSMFIYQNSPQIPGGQDGTWSVGGRYAAADSRWHAALSARPFQLGAHASFHFKVSDSIQLGAEFESNLQQQANTATLGYQYDLARANLTFKAQVDSNWNIAASLEKKLTPFPFTFSLCGVGSHSKARYTFGVGFVVG